jgi:hypothetical protein
MQIGWRWYASHSEPHYRPLTIGYLIQLEDVAWGLMYIHSQGMIHGDLKGVRFWWPVPPPSLTDFPYQGKHPNRPNWPRPAGRLWPACDHQGPHKCSDLEHILTGRHSPVDEPGAYRSTTVRVKEQLPNGILRLLCIWNGDIRNDQREPAISQRRRHNSFREGYTRETSPSRSKVQEGFVGDVGTVLGVSTEQPPKHRRCSSVFGGVIA